MIVTEYTKLPIARAIYWYGSLNHSGMGCPLYEAQCLTGYNPSMTETEPNDVDGDFDGHETYLAVKKMAPYEVLKLAKKLKRFQSGKMNKYRVTEYHQTTLYFDVEAENEDEAKEIASDRGWDDADDESTQFQESEVELMREGKET